MPPDEKPNPILWLPILTELGEDVIARIMDQSPDTADAILKARENFRLAQDEGEALRRKGHENE